MAGATYAAIAQAVGYTNKQGAEWAVRRALQKTIQEPADQMRQLDLHRLDQMLLAVWGRAKGGNLDCIDMVLKILARRARLLGLDAPEKQVITGERGEPVKIQVVFHEMPAVIEGEMRYSEKGSQLSIQEPSGDGKAASV